MLLIQIYLYRVLFFAGLLLTQTLLFSQTIGSKVSVLATDGKTYSGIIKNIDGDSYQIQYDGYASLYWLKANQFTLVTADSQENNLIGKSVHFPGTDGKKYTGIIREAKGNKYLIKYDGYDFESWLDRSQFEVGTITGNASAMDGEGMVQTATIVNNSTALHSLKTIYDFGNQKGWSSQLYSAKFTSYVNSLSAKDQQALLNFLRQATTSSARFFALKSLITGDNFEVVQKFIAQLNQYPETYQQENCVVTNRRALVQQWQYSCSVTMLQTFLADLSPRYAWELKQIANFDVVANDPNCPLALQQKQLLEKYGGSATVRGDMTGTSIGIIGPLSDFVTPILGVSFYAQEATEPLTEIFSKVRAQLDKGINVPLLVGFVGTNARHFILVMRYTSNGVQNQYLIYDPWDGRCDYVNESSILQGSLAPLLTEYSITLDYYYPVN